MFSIEIENIDALVLWLDILLKGKNCRKVRTNFLEKKTKIILRTFFFSTHPVPMDLDCTACGSEQTTTRY